MWSGGITDAELELRHREINAHFDELVGAAQHQQDSAKEQIASLGQQRNTLPEQQHVQEQELHAEREKLAGGYRQLDEHQRQFAQTQKQLADTASLYQYQMWRYIADAERWIFGERFDLLERTQRNAEDVILRWLKVSIDFAAAVADSHFRASGSAPRELTNAAGAQPTDADVRGTYQRWVEQDALVKSTGLQIEAEAAQLENQQRQLDIMADQQSGKMKLAADDLSRQIVASERNVELSRKNVERIEAERRDSHASLPTRATI